jgi:hypothetical protein
MKTPEAWAQQIIDLFDPGNPLNGSLRRDIAALVREAVEAAAPRWIPVGERLPERGQWWVLTLSYEELVGRYDHDDEEWRVKDPHRFNGDIAWSSVTHWMPLPPDPAS